jgi:hypothetical protein
VIETTGPRKGQSPYALVPLRPSVSVTAACRSCGVYPARDERMVFDAHDRAYAAFKGGCQRGIYYNMKAAAETIRVARSGSTIAFRLRGGAGRTVASGV